MLKFKFIGANNSMGLKKNSVHSIKTSIKDNLLWITWETNSCPYENLEVFLQNWGLIIEK